MLGRRLTLLGGRRGGAFHGNSRRFPARLQSLQAMLDRWMGRAEDIFPAGARNLPCGELGEGTAQAKPEGIAEARRAGVGVVLGLS